MITQTIQSFATTMSDGGYGNYVIVDLAKTGDDVCIPEDLPHNIAAFVDREKTALEFMIDEDEEDAKARNAYQEIVRACFAINNGVRGTITLIEDGKVEATLIA